MGRIARTWDLMGQSYAILKTDKEMLWLPLCSIIATIAISVTMLSGGVLLFLPQMRAMAAAPPHAFPLTQGMWIYTFLFYLVNYYVVIFFNVALVAIASNRLSGGNATLNDGLQLAWQRKGKIFEWALLAATVGILLRALEDRSRWLGRLVAGIIGMAWTLSTFFVVPLIAAEGLGPGEALSRSAALFRENWGEEVVGGFSFGFIFSLLGLPALLLPIYAGRFGIGALIVAAALAVLYWLLLAVVSATLQGIFMAALYRYATTKNIPPGFNASDFREAWQPR